MGGGAKPIVHGGGSLLGFPGGTRTLAPEFANIGHAATQYSFVKSCQTAFTTFIFHNFLE